MSGWQEGLSQPWQECLELLRREGNSQRQPSFQGHGKDGVEHQGGVSVSKQTPAFFSKRGFSWKTPEPFLRQNYLSAA